MPTIPSLKHFCELTVALGAPRELGDGIGGRRRIIPIIGGTVSGDGIGGKILNVGADWQTVFVDGVAHLDTRYAFETDDGALIEVINQGFRHGPEAVIERLAKGEICDPDSYYMRTTARLETGHPSYAWVNRMVFVGSGERRPDSVLMTLYTVL